MVTFASQKNGYVDVHSKFQNEQYNNLRKERRKEIINNNTILRNNQKNVNLLNKIDRLSADEHEAVNSYISSDSYKKNDILRSGTELGEWEKTVINMDQALDKLPLFQGNLYRTVTFFSDEARNEFLKDFQKGKVIKFKEYISTSKITDYNENAEIFITISNSRRCRDVTRHNPEEQEVIYHRNSKFITTDEEYVDDTWLIRIREI